ncbi:protein of unknown function [Microbacterium sp. Nx66]|nr:protein of unknown function [Microbacterium sp. Nx66]
MSGARQRELREGKSSCKRAVGCGPHLGHARKSLAISVRHAIYEGSSDDEDQEGADEAKHAPCKADQCVRGGAVYQEPFR